MADPTNAELATALAAMADRVSFLEGISDAAVAAATGFAIALSRLSPEHGERARSTLLTKFAPMKLAPDGEAPGAALRRVAAVQMIDALSADIYAAMPRPR